MTGGVSERLLCHDGNLQSVDLDGAHLQNEIKYSDLGCAKSVQETLHETNRKCGPHEKLGVIVEIGWTLYGSFKPMIRICHDVNSEHTFFAFHEVVIFVKLSTFIWWLNLIKILAYWKISSCD